MDSLSREFIRHCLHDERTHLLEENPGKSHVKKHVGADGPGEHYAK